MKKYVALFWIIAMMGIGFSGCDDKTASTEDVNNTEDSGQAAAATVAANEELSKELLSEFADPDDEYKAGARFVVDDYDASNPDYEAELTSQLQNLKEQGFAYIELENHVDWKADRDNFLVLLHLVYDVCNELGMKVDLRVGGTTMGSTEIAGNTPVVLGQTDPVTLTDGKLSKGTAFTGTQTFTDGDTFDPSAVTAALAITYDTDASGNKVQTAVQQLDPADFDLEYEIKTVETTEADSDGGGPSNSSSDEGAEKEIRQLTLTYSGLDLTFDGKNTDIIVYYESEGTAEISNDDFYSTASAHSYIDLLDEVLDDSEADGEPSLKELIKENGGYFTSDGGDNNQTLGSDTWSDEFLAKVNDMYGYDFGDYLAVHYSGYKLSDDSQNQIENDWNLAFANLFCDYNEVVKTWAESYNSGWRSQVGYSTELDHQVVATSVTCTDVESLYSRNEIDNYLSVISPAHLADIDISNLECAAVWEPYMSTWKELLFSANTSFVAGINRMFYHVVSFNMSDDLTLGYPGYSYNDSLMDWGVTNPLSEQTDVVNDYVNRMQYLLQSGDNVRDFMIYNDTFDQRYEVDDAVTEAGYTYDIVSSSVLELDNALEVSEGVINPSKGQYRAFVVSHLLDDQYMQLDTAETILKYAQNNVPIIVVGNENTFIDSLKPKNYSNDLEADAQVLKETWNNVKETGMLSYVPDEAALPDALEGVGVEAGGSKSNSSSIYSNCLTMEDGSTLYYLYNTDLYYPVFGNTFFSEYTDEEQLKYFPEYANGKGVSDTPFAPALAWGIEYVGKTVTQTLTFKATGKPYLLDAWTGIVTPIADYQVLDDGHISVNVTLDAGDTCIIGFAGANSDSEVHVQMLSETGSFGYADGELCYKADRIGTTTVKLSDGTTADVTCDSVGTSELSKEWNLSVDAWSAAYANPSTPKELITTAHETLITGMDALQTWEDLTFTNEAGAEVSGEKVCGVGTYTTTITVDGNVDGAILYIERASDIAEVYVNDTNVHLNQQSRSADFSDLLVQGENTLKIVIATNFNNYMNADAIGTVTMFEEPYVEQKYGISGIVTITPYVNVPIK